MTLIGKEKEEILTKEIESWASFGNMTAADETAGQNATTTAAGGGGANTTTTANNTTANETSSQNNTGNPLSNIPIIGVLFK